MLIELSERRIRMIDVWQGCMQLVNPMMVQPELAKAYVPYQQYMASYSPEEALEKGTMFPELYRPYEKHDRAWRGLCD